ncbi:MAG: hypothetical protein QM497_03370 [Sulfurimonas sp.]
MYSNDILIAFTLMTVLFLRQITILKQANKINYAPLVLGVGAISSVIHFIIHPNADDLVLLFRESFLPFLVSLFLFIVMNIMHQKQRSDSAKTQDDFLRVLVSEISGLKEFMSDLQDRVDASHKEDLRVQDKVRQKFKDDIKALEEIKINQDKFAIKFDEMEAWHTEVSKGFEHFTDVQLPELDNVVHKHIDILRVAEQDHYNQINATLKHAVDSRCEMSDDIDEVKSNISSMKSMSGDISRAITKHTLEQLSGVTKSFENQIIALKTHSESIQTALFEGDSTLSSIREKSELIMKQMVLSSNKMNELEKQNSGLQDVYSVLNDLIKDIEIIRSDYVKSQSQLDMISKDISNAKYEKVEAMTNQINSLGEALSKKIDESLEKLHEHYHIAEDDITQSVQMLSKKAQSKKGYGEFES